MTIPLILASASPRRLSLLRDIGIIPDQVIAADIDETPYRTEGPRELAARLSRDKLQTIAARFPDAYIIAADTVVGCGRRILPKAETPQDVRDCLTLLSGRRHRVFTGVAIHAPGGKTRQRIAESIVTFNRLSPADIEAYVASAEGQGKAGGYAIQGRAAAYIRFISGSYSNIVGLPLFDVAQMLKGLGYDTP